jgi:hypothetical protein
MRFPFNKSIESVEEYAERGETERLFLKLTVNLVINMKEDNRIGLIHSMSGAELRNDQPFPRCFLYVS